MSKSAYFKDQRFLLAFIYSANGLFVDKPSVYIGDENDESLVIASRSGKLEEPGSFFRRPGVVDMPSVEDPASICVDCWRDFERCTDDELLEKYDNDQDLVSLVKEIGEVGNRSFAEQFIVLAYDDGRDVGVGDARYLMVKRGGFELVVEFLLSNFNQGAKFNKNSIPEIGDRQFCCACDDEVVRWFDFSLGSDFMCLEDEDWIDDCYLDDMGCGYKINRFISGIDKKSLVELNAKFVIPERVLEILTDDQKMLLSNRIMKDLSELSDFIGIRLFRQQFSSFKEDLQFEQRMLAGRFWEDNNRELTPDD